MLEYEKTGEVRPPREGELFEDWDGNPVRAKFNFKHNARPILRESPALPEKP